ncbi:MAG: metalloenzyme [Anaerolineales bacterium]
MKVIFLFLDGVGLGDPRSAHNPFNHAHTPFLDSLLEGQKLGWGINKFHNEIISVFELDASGGVSGIPQSATGQAMLLTGKNIPQQLGYHYGPKPNPEIAAYITNGNLFNTLRQNGYRSHYLNAFPPLYFENIASGRRLYSAIPLAVISAGIKLNTIADLIAGRAISADFTNEGWRSYLGITGIPTLTPSEAGKRISEIASGFDLTFFEYWLTDYAGHRQNMAEAIHILETIDRVLESIVTSLDLSETMVWVTSDHGNLEDLSHRRHTLNPVPLLVIGAEHVLTELSSVHALPEVYPALLRLFPSRRAE